MFKFLKSDWGFAFFFSAVLIFTAFIPYFHEIRQTPKDNIFLGVHNNALDYPMFISEIIQSQRGRWTFLVKFTSEAQPGTLVHPIYIPLGKLGALLNLSPPTVYHLARVLFGFTLSLSAFYFICQVFSKNEKVLLFSKRKLAFFLALFSAGFTALDWTNFPPRIQHTYLDWWTGGDVLRRAVFQPHAMLKNTLLLLIIVWMGKLLSSNMSSGSRFNLEKSPPTGGIPLRRDNLKYLYFSLPAGVLLGLLDPMNTITILLLLGLYTLYKTIKLLIINLKNNHITAESSLSEKSSGHFLIRVNSLFIRENSYLFYFFLYSVLAFLALLYMNWVFSHTPWKAVKDWEANQFYVVPFWDYAKHIGLTFYLGALGLPLLIFRKRNLFTFYTTFLTVVPIFLITTGITQRFGLSTLRFFQTPVYIFLAIFSTELLSHLFLLIKKIFIKCKVRNTQCVILYYSLLFIFCILLFIPSLPAYIYSYQNQWNEFQTWHWNIYPDKKTYDLMVWLKKNTPLDSVVLTNSLVGNVLPAVSGNTVYIGHIVSTVNYSQKETLVKEFLNGTMEESKALKMLKAGRVDYLMLVWGEQYRVEEKNYPFLKKIFGNEIGSIYQFKPK